MTLASSQPLAIDLFCGLGGWTEGLLAEGYYVVGFDIEQHVYGEHRYLGQLVIQDVTTLHGSQFKDAALIVASPPCQEFSYMAMPWTRAKQIARALRGEDEFPEGYSGSRTPAELTALFDACFRIQREACEAAGRHIPMVVENVRGAQPWVGRARWMYGSFALWGDVPSLMPQAIKMRKTKGHANKRDGHSHTRHLTNQRESDALKQPGINLSEVGFNVANALEFKDMVKGVKIKRSEKDKRDHIGTSRKFASAMIAKIPLPLSRHIGATFRPKEARI